MVFPESGENNAPARPWLSIIGIGEDGIAGLGDNARTAISTAGYVFGGKRHLELAASLVGGEARPWPTPFDATMRGVLALRGEKVCVLASGDPFLFGVGVTLARHIAGHEFVAIPAPSSFSLAASRLGWALQDVETVSLHGRPVDLIRPYLHSGTRIIALTSDANGPQAVAGLLAQNGFGASRIAVLEALGGGSERLRTYRADSFDAGDINTLNVLGIEVEADAQARILPLGFGLDDALFEHDGQITKQEIRALTLPALSPRRGELLWDIGAGSGSISIEWMLAHPSMRAVAVEANAGRAARVARNASAFGVPGLAVIHGKAPAVLAGLPQPDAIFIGGGGSRHGVTDAAMAALRPGGRLVANAVTLEMEAVLLAAHADHGGRLLRLEVSRNTALGGMSALRPALPVTQWIWVKP